MSTWASLEIAGNCLCTTLPRLGSWVRIPSPAPNFFEITKWFVGSRHPEARSAEPRRAAGRLTMPASLEGRPALEPRSDRGPFISVGMMGPMVLRRIAGVAAQLGIKLHLRRGEQLDRRQVIFEMGMAKPPLDVGDRVDFGLENRLGDGMVRKPSVELRLFGNERFPDRDRFRLHRLKQLPNFCALLVGEPEVIGELEQMFRPRISVELGGK